MISASTERACLSQMPLPHFWFNSLLDASRSYLFNTEFPDAVGRKQVLWHLEDQRLLTSEVIHVPLPSLLHDTQHAGGHVNITPGCARAHRKGSESGAGSHRLGWTHTGFIVYSSPV